MVTYSVKKKNSKVEIFQVAICLVLYFTPSVSSKTYIKLTFYISQRHLNNDI